MSKKVIAIDIDDEALPLLRELKKRYSLVVVTSRRTTIKQPTIEWLNKFYSDVFDDIHFAGVYDGGQSDMAYAGTKLGKIQEVGASYLIDDQTKHCFAAARAGIKTVLFGNYKWNQVDELPANVVRCHDWPAVAEYFRNEQ